jgi:hypothetical protein
MRKIAKNSLSGSFLPSKSFSEEIKHHAKEIVKKLEALLSDPILTDPDTRKKYEALLIKQKAIMNEHFQHDLFTTLTLNEVSFKSKTDAKFLECLKAWTDYVKKIDDLNIAKKLERKENVKADFKEKSYYNRNKNGKQKPSPFLVNLVGKVNESR